MVSSFNDRPGKLFGDLQHARLCIILHDKGDTPGRTFSTAYNRWRSVERPFLFQRLTHVETTGLDGLDLNLGGILAKVGTPIEVSLLRKVCRERKTVGDHTAVGGPFPLYYTRKLSHFVQVLDFVPRITDDSGRDRPPSELKVLRFARETERDVFLAVLNSSLFYWLVTVLSDCRNLNKREVEGMRFDLGRADDKRIRCLAGLGRSLMDDLRSKAKVLPMKYGKKVGTLRIQCTYPGRSKPLLDEIDAVLAGHHGLSAAELDFVINFDIKYRLSVSVSRKAADNSQGIREPASESAPTC
jgi:hypothetical protein